MFLRSIWVNLGRQNCLFQRRNLVVVNYENVNNEHYDIAFENYDSYYKQSLLYCVRACDLAPNQIDILQGFSF